MKFFILFAGFFSLTTSVNAAGLLDLESFLQQVRSQNQNYQAALLSSDGARRRSREGHLQIWPSLQAGAQYSFDDKNDPMSQISEQTRGLYTLSIVEQTPVGLTAKLNYQLSSNKYHIEEGARPSRDYWDGRPSLELSQSLGRNFFGSELRASIRSMEAAARAVSFMESYRAKVILSQAEVAYWSMSAARTQLKITDEVLKRASELYKFAKSRADLQLTDKADRLQAEALLRLRQLELKNAENLIRSQSRLFNEWRNQDSDKVLEELENVEQASYEAPARAIMREDVLAALEQQKASEAQSSLGKNRVLPLVDVYGSFALNGTDDYASEAFSDSFSKDEPAYAFGLRVNLPLHFGIVKESFQGYEQEAKAAQKTYARKLFEQESQWKDLELRLAEAKERLELSLILEKVQKEKMSIENHRLNRARTTMFQVIQSELDFASSQVNRIRNQVEILQLISQMKTFGGNS